MKKIILFLAIAMFSYCSYAQSFFTTSPYANSPQGVGANSIFGWGENFDRTIDVRPNPHPTFGTMMINYHTGLTLSAHSQYGGIRFYNQGYPNPYDPATGSVMVMSIVNGSVGIGNTSPNQKLDVSGNVLFRGSGSFYNNPGSAELQLGYGFASPGTIGAVTRLALQPYGHTGGPWKFDTRDNASMAFLDIYYGSGVGTGMTMDNTGNVSIGTVDAHGYKLAVNGAAIATSMTVKLHTNWPDYVFKPNYRLPSLAAVKAYIDQNQHLPEMPSEQEVKDNGINLGEIVKVQTKKIEELTLYAIEQQKQIDELKAQLKNITKNLSKN
ncbi:MAG TPA: hypothetical protein VL442_07265 [Mucilaginibacter sp.]|jgi:hypothetical protein|nr:hypothetical protein [Mucilaginibacter sp.]